MWILENLALVFMISINYRIPLMFFCCTFGLKKLSSQISFFKQFFVQMYWLTFGCFLTVENDI